MNTLVKCALGSVIILGAASGCSRNDSSELAADKGSRNVTTNGYLQLPNNAILMRCNGQELSKEVFERMVALRKRVVLMTMPQSSQVKIDQLTMIDENMRAVITNAFSIEAVGLQYADRNGIKADKKQISACRQNFMTACNANGSSWNKFLKRFTDVERQTINERVLSEATQIAAKEGYLSKNRVNITDEELAEIKMKFDAYNKRCAATNECVRKLAADIRKRVERGESFEKLAIRYDQDESRTQTGEWGEFAYADFADEPELAKEARKFRTGYVTPPIEGDNGLMLVKVISIEDPLNSATESKDYIPSPNATFKLARIFLHLPEFIEKFDEETLKHQAQVAKDNADYSKFIHKLVSEAKIEYPSGVDIFAVQKKANVL